MFRWIIRLVLLTLVGGFLHYTLPQHDVVRITDTYEKRVDFGSSRWFWAAADAGAAADSVNRDVFFIQAFQPDDHPMIYRNEDTGWGWPPYFKFDTANLQAEASDLTSKKGADTAQWAMVTHYGWRNEFLSIYPNAVSVRAVSGPDVTVTPWFNIVILIVLAGLFWAVWVRWVRFRTRRVDPVTERIGDWFADRLDWMRGR